MSKKVKLIMSPQTHPRLQLSLTRLSRRIARPSARQQGGMMVLVGGLLIILTGFAVLAIDVGRVFIVRNELQNVADSAALAGANCMMRQSSGSNCLSTYATALNWTGAAAKAQAQLAMNAADNRAVSTTDAGHTIEVGYWNLLTGTPSGGSFSSNFSPLTTYDRPAVRVALAKDAGKNGGPVIMLTRLMFGGVDVPMRAQAVAVISAPGSVAPGGVIPFVINKCMFDKYWDSAAGKPRLYSGNPVDPYGLSTVGKPWVVRIGSAYSYGLCDSGQWTSFDSDANMNSRLVVARLIANGNSNTLAIGEDTWIQPGARNISYQDLDAKYPTPTGSAGYDVSVVVVDDGALNTHGHTQKIIAFGGFHISDIDPQGAHSYIQGSFINGTITSGGGGVGPFYGSFTPPRLAQ